MSRLTNSNPGLNLVPDKDSSMTINDIHNKLNNNKQKGGFRLFESHDSFNNVIKNTKHSENIVIEKYKKMYSNVKDYYIAYDNHLNNLKKLDKYVNFSGMTGMFKKVIVKNYFTHGSVDKSLPILFNNYAINEETSYKQFRKDHIMQQIYYVIDTYFSDKGGMTNIKYLFLDVAKAYFILYITNKADKTENYKIAHTDYLIDIQDTIDKIQDIIVVDKSKLKQKKEVLTFDDNDKIITSTANLLELLKKPNSTKRTLSHKKTKRHDTHKRNSNDGDGDSDGDSNNTQLSLIDNLNSNSRIRNHSRARTKQRTRRTSMYNNSSNNTNSSIITKKSKFKRNRSHKQSSEKIKKDKQPSNAIEAKKNEILTPLPLPQQQTQPQIQQPFQKSSEPPDSEGCSLLSGTTRENCKANKKCGWNLKTNMCFKYPNPNPNLNQQQYPQNQYQSQPNQPQYPQNQYQSPPNQQQYPQNQYQSPPKPPFQKELSKDNIDLNNF